MFQLVDSTADDPDALLDGNCQTGAGFCTVRAALEEASFVTEYVLMFWMLDCSAVFSVTGSYFINTGVAFGTFGTPPCTWNVAPSGNFISITAGAINMMDLWLHDTTITAQTNAAILHTTSSLPVRVGLVKCELERLASSDTSVPAIDLQPLSESSLFMRRSIVRSVRHTNHVVMMALMGMCQKYVHNPAPSSLSIVSVDA